jgi:hypothetical protein
MVDSSTNPPPATTAAPTSASAENLGTPLENTPPVVQTTTSTAPAEASIAPGQSTAAQIFSWMTKMIVAQIQLPEDVAELVAFWAISTWFQETQAVFPCLVITGPAHEAMVLLRILKNLCRGAGLVAEFRRADLKDLNFHTVLISAPNLDNRAAALLGNLTNPGFIIVDQRSFLRRAASRAIYIGEDSSIKKIQHSIYINITQTAAEPPTTAEWLQSYIRVLPAHLEQYREKNVEQVRRSTFAPYGGASGTAAVTKALGCCIIGAPELRKKLLAHLNASARQDRSQQSGTVDDLVVEAALTLSREGREHAYTSEVASEANRLAELRGEQRNLKPEKVGRRLCQLGLRTRRLTLAGNGLTFDTATINQIQKLAAMYVEEDLLPGNENLYSLQPTENKHVEEVM